MRTIAKLTDEEREQLQERAAELVFALGLTRNMANALAADAPNTIAAWAALAGEDLQVLQQGARTLAEVLDD